MRGGAKGSGHESEAQVGRSPRLEYALRVRYTAVGTGRGTDSGRRGRGGVAAEGGGELRGGAAVARRGGWVRKRLSGPEQLSFK